MITGCRVPAAPGNTWAMGFRSVRQRLRRIAKSLALRIPPITKAIEELESYRQTFRFVPAGHFYSPLPSLEDVKRDAGRLFGSPPETLPGIELNEATALSLSPPRSRSIDGISMKTLPIPTPTPSFCTA